MNEIQKIVAVHYTTISLILLSVRVPIPLIIIYKTLSLLLIIYLIVL